MIGAEIKSFRLRHHLSPDALARFVGLRARDAARNIYRWEAGATPVPDSVAQIVKLADRLPAARLMLAGELSREAQGLAVRSSFR